MTVMSKLVDFVHHPHLPHWGLPNLRLRLHLRLPRRLPRFRSRSAQRLAAAEEELRRADKQFARVHRSYSVLVFKQATAAVRRAEQELALQRQLGQLVATHAALVAARLSVLAEYRTCASELPLCEAATPIKRRTQVVRACDSVGERAARACFAVKRAREQDDLPSDLAGELVRVQLELLCLKH
ncbi:MAG: hypothetical protein MHM6MM_003313 [Cercozoa sp. M6MM]